MKKLFIALLAGLAIAACTPSVTLTPDKTTLEFPAAGGQETIEVAGATGTVEASADAEWCTVSVNATRVIVDVQVNDTEAQRNATITISFKGATTTVSVTQAGATIDFSGLLSEVEAGIAAKTVSLGTIVSNVEPEITADVDWITNPLVSEQGEVTVDVAANTTGVTRSGVVTVAVGSVKQDVTVLQTNELGLSLSHEVIEPEIMGEKQVNITIECVGTTKDFAFAIFNPETATWTDEQFLEELKAGYGTNNGIYNKAYYDQVVEQNGIFGFMLAVNQTHVFVGVAIDENGNFAENVVRDYIELDVIPAEEEYRKWLGDWTVNTQHADGTSGTYEISILQPEPTNFSTFVIEGWMGASTTDGLLNIPALAGFDSQTYDLVFYGAECGITADGMRAVYIFPCTDVVGGSFYTALGAEMARMSYSESGNIALSYGTLETGDQGIVQILSLIMVSTQDASTWTLYAPSTLDETGETFQFELLWVAPTSFTQTSNASSAYVKPYSDKTVTGVTMHKAMNFFSNDMQTLSK